MPYSGWYGALTRNLGSAQGDQDITGDAVVTATAPIPAGTEITISYIDTAQPMQERQVILGDVRHDMKSVCFSAAIRIERRM